MITTPPEDCNASSRASSVTVNGDPVDDGDTSSVTAQETSPSASEESVTVIGDSPSEASFEASHASGSQDQAPDFNPSLKVSILVCRIESVSIDSLRLCRGSAKKETESRIQRLTRKNKLTGRQFVAQALQLEE
jgi:hypothetical protein